MKSSVKSKNKQNHIPMGGCIAYLWGHFSYINDDDEEEMSAHYTHNLFINPETGDWFIMEPLY